MNLRTSLAVLSILVIPTAIVNAACGGKVGSEFTPERAADPPSSPGAVATARAPATGTATAPSSGGTTALQPCPADSTPLPTPASPDPALLSICKQSCERDFACVGCAFATCLPNCLFDGLATRASGPAFVKWKACRLEQDVACGDTTTCQAEYCDYLRAGTSPGYPLGFGCD